MEPIAGLHYVLPYLALEFVLVLISSVTGQVRAFSIASSSRSSPITSTA